MIPPMALSYEELKSKPKTLRAMTSLHPSEFNTLLVAFTAAWNEMVGSDPAKGGRPPVIKVMADRLLFILFYLKTYPLQAVIAHLFGLSQPQAHFLIHQLAAVLGKALEAGGHKPARLTDDMVARLQKEGAQILGIDGTERRVQRPQDPVGQRAHYSGKKKCHTVKNNLVGGLEDRQVKYLGPVHEGKKHDKKLCDEEGTRFPEGTELYRDSAYQGHEVPGTTIHQPTKKPRGGPLSADQKAGNRLISSVRVVVEHIISGVKRCRIVKDVFRNTKEGFDDVAMELACGLHNYRSSCRHQSY